MFQLLILSSLNTRRRQLTVRGNGMSIEVADTLDLVCSASQFHFVALHGLLDGCPNVTEPGINASLTDASVCGSPHSFHQSVILVIECQRECTIDDSAWEKAGKKMFSVLNCLSFRPLSYQSIHHNSYMIISTQKYQ